MTPLTTEKGTVGGVVLRFCGLWFLLWTTAHVPIHPSVFRTVHVSGSELQKLPWDFTVSSNERQHHISGLSRGELTSTSSSLPLVARLAKSNALCSRLMPSVDMTSDVKSGPPLL
jgi:hypothetical protein